MNLRKRDGDTKWHADVIGGGPIGTGYGVPFTSEHSGIVRHELATSLRPEAVKLPYLKPATGPTIVFDVPPAAMCHVQIYSENWANCKSLIDIGPLSDCCGISATDVSSIHNMVRE